jgi:hypothetical protein
VLKKSKWVAWREELNAIAAGKRQLRRGWLLELDGESHHVAQKMNHPLVLAHRDTKPAQTQDFHRSSFPASAAGPRLSSLRQQ